MVSMRDAIQLAKKVRDDLRGVADKLERAGQPDAADKVTCLRKQAIKFLEDAGHED